ncbi:hypothetical protein [Bacillus sp. FSL L8-0152]
MKLILVVKALVLKFTAAPTATVCAPVGPFATIRPTVNGIFPGGPVGP